MPSPGEVKTHKKINSDNTEKSPWPDFTNKFQFSILQLGQFIACKDTGHSTWEGTFLWNKKMEKGSLGANREKSSLGEHICKAPKAENRKDKKVVEWLAHSEQEENGGRKGRVGGQRGHSEPRMSH